MKISSLIPGLLFAAHLMLVSGCGGSGEVTLPSGPPDAATQDAIAAEDAAVDAAERAQK